MPKNVTGFIAHTSHKVNLKWIKDFKIRQISINYMKKITLQEMELSKAAIIWFHWKCNKNK